jgi:hypothetical protein
MQVQIKKEVAPNIESETPERRDDKTLSTNTEYPSKRLDLVCRTKRKCKAYFLEVWLLVDMEEVLPSQVGV